MLRYLLLIVFFISCGICSYAQNHLYNGAQLDTSIHLRQLPDSLSGSFDSTHYFFTQYIRLKNKGVPDSINHWYFKLNNKK